MFLLKLFFFLLFSIVENNADYCLSKDNSPYMYYSTKTPYDTVRGNIKSTTTCKPIQIWLLSRHGTRHAEDEEITTMQRVINLKKELIANEKAGLLPLTGGLCPEDLLAIKNWTWHDTAQVQSGFLTEQGRSEHNALAKRLKTNFPSLLNKPYDPVTYYFRHTNMQRTNQSCRAFIDGLFGNEFNKNVDIVSRESDIILVPFGSCQLWIDNVDNDTNFYEPEQPAFRECLEFQNMIKSVSRKLGRKDMISQKDLMAIYANCRFDKSEYLKDISPWCSFLPEKYLRLLEYYEDIGRYYKYSYGQDINKKLGRLTLRHLLEMFDKTVKNNGVVNGHTFSCSVAHDTTFDMVFTKLNFAKDPIPLSGTNYQDFLLNRKYRSSLYIPFCANIVAVLHDCGVYENERFKVQFFINEKRMQIPGCVDGLCNWSYLKQLYSDYKSWNLDFCNNPTS